MCLFYAKISFLAFFSTCLGGFQGAYRQAGISMRKVVPTPISDVLT